MEGGLFVIVLLAIITLIILAKTAIVVPQQSAFVVERLGRFAGVLDAGFHILVPFIDVIRYQHSLKEMALDIPAQICITRDNVQVQVDGVLYLKVLNPERTSYGITDYMFAISQLAQTTLRSEVGKIDLDRTFEERTNINISVVAELDKATEPWGVKVLRYEIKNITPPADILAAMEKQMRAEREKRAVILTSEGQRDAAINSAEGEKQQIIKASEARRQQQINEAEGQASAILAVATANAEGIKRVAEATQAPGGAEAIQLKVAEQYIAEFGKVINNADTIILPSNLSRRGVDDHHGDERRRPSQEVVPQSPAMRFKFDQFVIDGDRRTCHARRRRKSTSRPRRSTSCWPLLARAPNAVSKAELMATLWPDTHVSDATLTGVVADAREALGDDGRAPRVIRTLHRFGYAFTGQIEREVERRQFASRCWDG